MPLPSDLSTLPVATPILYHPPRTTAIFSSHLPSWYLTSRSYLPFLLSILCPVTPAPDLPVRGPDPVYYSLTIHLGMKYSVSPSYQGKYIDPQHHVHIDFLLKSLHNPDLNQPIYAIHIYLNLYPQRVNIRW